MSIVKFPHSIDTSTDCCICFLRTSIGCEIDISDSMFVIHLSSDIAFANKIFQFHSQFKCGGNSNFRFKNKKVNIRLNYCNLKLNLQILIVTCLWLRLLVVHAHYFSQNKMLNSFNILSKMELIHIMILNECVSVSFSLWANTALV